MNPYFLYVNYVMMVPWIDQMEHATDRKIRKAQQTTVHEKSIFQRNFCMTGTCWKSEILASHAQFEGVRLNNSAPPGASGWTPEAPHLRGGFSRETLVYEVFNKRRGGDR